MEHTTYVRVLAPRNHNRGGRRGVQGVPVSLWNVLALSKMFASFPRVRATYPCRPPFQEAGGGYRVLKRLPQCRERKKRQATLLAERAYEGLRHSAANRPRATRHDAYHHICIALILGTRHEPNVVLEPMARRRPSFRVQVKSNPFGREKRGTTLAEVENVDCLGLQYQRGETHFCQLLQVPRGESSAQI